MIQSFVRTFMDPTRSQWVSWLESPGMCEVCVFVFPRRGWSVVQILIPKVTDSLPNDVRAESPSMEMSPEPAGERCEVAWGKSLGKPTSRSTGVIEVVHVADGIFCYLTGNPFGG